MTDLLQGFLSGSAAWGVLLTLAAFALGTLLNKATGKAIFNPLLLGSIFVIILLSVLNIPYADFYKAAGVDNASEIDAVTSATKNKTRAGNLAAGSYHVNANGTDITGVSFPVKVLTPWALENAKQVTDADSYEITAVSYPHMKLPKSYTM